MSDHVLELLALPDHPRVALRESPLMLALCQVQFEGELHLADARVVAPFQEAVSPVYPHSSVAPREVTLRMDPSGVQQQVGVVQWTFRDTDDTWCLTLSGDALTLETRRYETFDDFLERLLAALAALRRVQSALAVKRIGLRYINEIREPSMPWGEIICAELLGPLAQQMLSPYVRQALQEIRLDYPDGPFITIRQGLLPAGTSVQPRQGQPIPEIPFYLLDFDAFREFGPESTEPWEPGLIRRYVEVFHASIYRLFRWAVSEAYVQKLAV